MRYHTTSLPRTGRAEQVSSMGDGGMPGRNIECSSPSNTHVHLGGLLWEVMDLVRPRLGKLDSHRPMSARYRASLAEINQSSAKIRRVWDEAGQIWAKLGPESTDCGPNAGRVLLNSGRCLADLGLCRAGLPECRQICPRTGGIGPTEADTRRRYLPKVSGIDGGGDRCSDGKQPRRRRRLAYPLLTVSNGWARRRWRRGC